jgi:26S proteasome regulatory subunit N11
MDTVSVGQEPRQTTSNVGHLKKPSIQALIHGLNRHYYSMVIDYRKNELEEQMLTNLYKQTWVVGLKARHFESHSTSNRDIIVSMSSYSSHYNGFIKDEEGKTAEEVLIANVGKVDPKRHLVNYSVPVCVFDSKQCVSNLQDNSVEELMSHNIVQLLGTMLSAIVF